MGEGLVTFALLCLAVAAAAFPPLLLPAGCGTVPGSGRQGATSSADGASSHKHSTLVTLLPFFPFSFQLMSLNVVKDSHIFSEIFLTTMSLVIT